MAIAIIFLYHPGSSKGREDIISEGVISSPTSFTVGEFGKPEFVYVRPLTERDVSLPGQNTTETHTLKYSS